MFRAIVMPIFRSTRL